VTCNIPLKSSQQGYNFFSNLISIRGLHTKLYGLKVVGVPTLGISRFPFGSSRTKCHLDVGLMEAHINDMRGKVVASLKSGPW